MAGIRVRTTFEKVNVCDVRTLLFSTIKDRMEILPLHQSHTRRQEWFIFFLIEIVQVRTLLLAVHRFFARFSLFSPFLLVFFVAFASPSLLYFRYNLNPHLPLFP
jgi:hypothetical protein